MLRMRRPAALKEFEAAATERAELVEKTVVVFKTEMRKVRAHTGPIL